MHRIALHAYQIKLHYLITYCIAPHFILHGLLTYPVHPQPTQSTTPSVSSTCNSIDAKEKCSGKTVHIVYCAVGNLLTLVSDRVSV